MKPIEVSKKYEHLVLQRILKNTKPKKEKRKPKVFNVGDKVRINKFKGVLI